MGITTWAFILFRTSQTVVILITAISITNSETRPTRSAISWLIIDTISTT